MFEQINIKKLELVTNHMLNETSKNSNAFVIQPYF